MVQEGLQLAVGQVWDARLAVTEGVPEDLGRRQGSGVCACLDPVVPLPPVRPSLPMTLTWKSDMDSNFSGSQGSWNRNM